MPHHADPCRQDTRGDRGKTTRRRSTHTTRGPEGQWIAQIKEDALTRPPGWLVMIERARYHGWCCEWKSETYSAGRFDAQAQADEHAATYRVGSEHMTHTPNGDTYIVRVWVEAEK